MSSDSDYVIPAHLKTRNIVQGASTGFTPSYPAISTAAKAAAAVTTTTAAVCGNTGGPAASTAPMNSSQKHPPPSVMASLKNPLKIEAVASMPNTNVNVETARFTVTRQYDELNLSRASSGNSTSVNDPGTAIERLIPFEFIKKHFERGPKQFHYNPLQVEELTQQAVDSFARQGLTSLVETNGPICICGDIHGQYSDLLKIFHACGPPSRTRYLFLGDYVDRGRHSLEVICLLLACKIQWPDHFFLIRGNHELSHINRLYGFYEELCTRFGPIKGEELWYRFNDVFTWMPLAASVGGKIICMHGGISPHMKSLDGIRDLTGLIPIVNVIEPGLVQDLLWSDPSPDAKQRGFTPNTYRNCSVMFGEEALLVKLKLLGSDMIVRAHQVAQFGYSTFGGGKLITVFSAPRYQPEMYNWAAVCHVDADLNMHFTLLKPKEYEGKMIEKEQKKDADEKRRQNSC